MKIEGSTTGAEMTTDEILQAIKDYYTIPSGEFATKWPVLAQLPTFGSVPLTTRWREIFESALDKDALEGNKP